MALSNKQLILCNLKLFYWRYSFLQFINKPLSSKLSYNDTRFFWRIAAESPLLKKYSYTFENKWNSLRSISLMDDPSYVKLNIDSISEISILNFALSTCINMWCHGVHFIAWLYTYYPSYNIIFDNNIELKFIDCWFQSVVVLDEVVTILKYNPYILHVPEKQARHGLVLNIILPLFLNKYIFNLLLYWWHKQDLNILNKGLPFDILVLSVESQLFFYIYHYIFSLSNTTLILLDSNPSSYPYLDDAEKNMLKDFENLQLKLLQKCEQEIHTIYSDYLPWNLVKHQYKTE